MTKLIKSRNFSIFIIIGLVLALIAGGSWFYFKYRVERSALGKKYADSLSVIETFKQDPTAASQAQADNTIAKVNKLYSLPKDEKPSVASVSDKAKLKDQPFFVNAENGDVTLIYTKAKLAILYRPSTDKLINVSSVTIQDKTTNPTPATNATPPNATTQTP